MARKPTRTEVKQSLRIQELERELGYARAHLAAKDCDAKTYQSSALAQIESLRRELARAQVCADVQGQMIALLNKQVRLALGDAREGAPVPNECHSET